MSKSSDAAWLVFEQLAMEYPHCNAVKLTLEMCRFRQWLKVAAANGSGHLDPP